MKKIILLLTILVQMSVAFSQHFVKGFVGDGQNHANVYITNAVINGVPLQAGDEIAVFDGNLCCGVVTLAQPIDPSNNATYVDLRPSANDGGLNGYVQGNTMYFRFWNGTEYHNVIPVVTNNLGNAKANAFDVENSSFVTLSTEVTTKTWNGSFFFPSWGIASNWTPSGVPEPNNDVVIPSVIGKQPLIFSTEGFYCGSLVFQSNPELTIYSDVSGTGSLIITSNISGAATVNAQRFMTGNSWHMVSSPLSGQTIAGFLTNNGAIPTNDALRGMMEYDEGVDNWNTFFTNSITGDVSLGKGFSVRTTSDIHVTFQGVLNSGNVVAPVTKDNFGWNLVGNPFTSAMYVRQEIFGFLVENDAMLDASFKAIYLWDPAANGGLGAYSIVNMDEGQANLVSGQGFFIKAASAGNVSFTKQMQVHQTDASFKSATISRPSIVLNAKAGDISSSTKISFNEEMTLGLDPGYDAGILRSGHGFDIYSRLVTDNGVDFMVQSLPGKPGDSYVIPIGVDATKGGEIVFSANASNLPVSYELMIEDKLTNSISNLKNGELYVAELASDTKGVGRFYLHVGSSVQTGIQEIQQDELNVYTIGQTVYIKGNVSNKAQFMVYSIDGRLINRFGATSQNLNQMSTTGFTPGIYFVKVQDKTKFKPVKFVVGK